MKNKSRAFTLIELLVVVLIIGILAAVAVPQYQKAVLRSRFVNIKVNMAAMIQAQRRYYLANNEYAADKGDLDISTSACFTNSGNIQCLLYSNGNKVVSLQKYFANDNFVCCAYSATQFAGEFLCQAEARDTTWYKGCEGCHCYSYH